MALTCCHSAQNARTANATAVKNAATPSALNTGESGTPAKG